LSCPFFFFSKALLELISSHTSSMTLVVQTLSFKINGIKPQSKLWTQTFGASLWEPSLRARRSQLNQNFSSVEAEHEGGLSSR
jgi:hypothetical protein